MHSEPVASLILKIPLFDWSVLKLMCWHNMGLHHVIQLCLCLTVLCYTLEECGATGM